MKLWQMQVADIQQRAQRLLIRRESPLNTQQFLILSPKVQSTFKSYLEEIVRNIEGKDCE